MRDSIGGVVNIQLILVFIALVSGYLAYSVNYTKAFRMKNKVISVLEKCEGKIDPGTSCWNEVEDYANAIGYNLGDQAINIIDRYINATPRKCDPDTIKYANLGFCYKETLNGEFNTEGLKKQQFRVVTAIYIDIPIINRFLPRVLRVEGDTKTIVTPDTLE